MHKHLTSFLALLRTLNIFFFNDEISHRIALRRFIDARHFLTTGTTLSIGTQTITKSASCTHVCMLSHSRTFFEILGEILFVSNTNMFAVPLLAKWYVNHLPILPAAPITAIFLIGELTICDLADNFLIYPLLL
jgi:hypothetical protein